MEKIKIHLEYMLRSGSAEVIWNMIGTMSGLEQWFADKITVSDKLYTFQWGKDERRTARLINIRSYNFIRFHWTDDEESRTYFELRMDEDELTGDCILSVTDFIEPEEEADIKKLWDFQVNTLKREAGL
ncbi:START-like domain-containing protein [Phocaeicola abscessus]|uniref:START-like domain-containing protein n=1 Tax=Phocaeicola abscessus TaxID=555313 RepID=UPI000386CBB6|nr:START-like domain-containing protein [Phocaeicola abscessus]EPT32715.1 hypothetical protein HMPREF9012_2011 [Bacteroidetes bacterium oral taxon 272 str. F0290]